MSVCVCGSGCVCVCVSACVCRVVGAFDYDVVLVSVCLSVCACECVSVVVYVCASGCISKCIWERRSCWEFFFVNLILLFAHSTLLSML